MVTRLRLCSSLCLIYLFSFEYLVNTAHHCHGGLKTTACWTHDSLFGNLGWAQLSGSALGGTQSWVCHALAG